jgi:uncharacterized protein (DUF1501 family)
MKRRDFIKKSVLAGIAPFALNSIPISLMGGTFEQMAAASCNDNILVILQMSGGNDGINMLVPLDDLNSGLYQFVRPNISLPKTGTRKVIPLDTTLGARNVGLHPDMIGIKNMYDAGKVSVIQGVSYKGHNQSHFRSRDIMFMGGGSADYLQSGWVGRYLKNEIAPKIYPKDFPNPDNLDPLALEFGNELSLVFHQGDQIPVSISVTNPQSFFNLVEQLPGFDDLPNLDPRGIPPTNLEGTLYSKELNWILGLEGKTEDYHDRLLQTYNLGKSKAKSVIYPEKYPFNAPTKWLKNPISGQLEIVANLIDGGSKTKVYLLKIGGFDTHAFQTNTDDASMGLHASLLYHISSAMEAFQEDLKQRGLDSRVLTITTSEFGRRIQSNGSWGTDHGIGAPMFVFGKHVLPGLIGDNPNLNLENVQMQYDYRQIYSSIMKDWFCVDAAYVDQQLFAGEYQGKGTKLPIIDTKALGVSDFINSRFYLDDCFPNPAKDKTTFSFYLNSTLVCSLILYDQGGNKIASVFENKSFDLGTHKVNYDLDKLEKGAYIYELNAGKLLKQSKKIIIN